VNFWNLIRDKHALVFKLALYLFSTLLLTWILPSDKRISEKTLNTLNFWPYEDLHAEYVFDYKKTTAELEEEKLKLLKESPLYFKEYSEEKNSNLKLLDQTLSNSGFNARYKIIKPIIDSIYARGVIEKVDGMDTSSVVFIVSNGIAEQKSRFEFFTITDAVSFIENQLATTPDKAELIQECIKYLSLTIRLDRALTDKNKADALASISHIKSTFAPGDLMVKNMESLSTEKKSLLLAYLQAGKKVTQSNWYNVLGRFIAASMLFGILMLYLAFFRRTIFGQNKQISFIFLVVILSAIISSVVSSYGTLFFWSLPFALIPVLIRIFFDSRTALFTFLITILFSSFFANDKFQFVFIQLIVGMGTVFSIVQMRRRKELLTSAVVVFVFYLFAFIAFNLVSGNEKILLQKTLYLPIIISSLLILLAYPFVFLAEKVFGFVSDFTLMELCDLNTPLLRELSLKVPGTFQHSLQVANLAEEAIFHIGGNALLVRAGAMYHDIGKMENSRYFTENQVGEVNPHNEILPEESAKIIISHVIKGVEIAKEHDLPESVIDFIRTHHGTTTAGFFLNNFKKEHKGEMVNEDNFRYPGPIPFSKETAVLMMADGVEAASRSLKKYDALSINELVDRIIEYKISENQLINAEITFKDINLVKKIFKKRLMNMYHVRIEYPR